MTLVMGRSNDKELVNYGTSPLSTKLLIPVELTASRRGFDGELTALYTEMLNENASVK